MRYFVIVFLFASLCYGDEVAIEFDGTDDYVDCGTDIVLAADLTLSFWVRPNDLSGIGDYAGLINKRAGDTHNTAEFSVRIYPTGNVNAKVGFTGGSPYIDTTGVAITTDDVWTHIAFTVEGSTGKLYANGVEVASDTDSGTRYSSGSLHTYLGQYYSGNRRFDGGLSKVQLYDKALSASEVKRLYVEQAQGRWVPDDPDIVLQP